MAERDRLSPTWLLLGEGPELVGTPAAAAQVGDALRRYVIARIGPQLRVAETTLEEILPPGEGMLATVISFYSAILAPRMLRELKA